jgi:hypothetical protein
MLNVPDVPAVPTQTSKGKNKARKQAQNGVKCWKVLGEYLSGFPGIGWPWTGLCEMGQRQIFAV